MREGCCTKSRERVVSALDLEEPDVVPSYEMLLSPPNTVKEILAREPVYANRKYLFELWSRGEMLDKESVNLLNKRSVEDCYEAYCKLDLDMIRFSLGTIRPPSSIKKVSDREWIVDGKRTLYESYSFWSWDPEGSLILKGPEYVHRYIKNEKKKLLEASRQDQLVNLRYMKRLNKEEKFILTDVGGIWGPIVSDRYGLTEFLKWFYLYSDVAKELIQFYADITIERGKAAIDEGADGVQICEDYGFEDGSWLSPKQFREFILPHLTRMSNIFRRKGAFFILHTDGNVMPILRMFAEAEVSAYQSIDKIAKMDLAVVKEQVGSEMCLIGNVDHSCLMSENLGEVKAEVKRCMKAAAHSGGYIIGCTGAMIDSRLPNLSALVRYSRRYGRYRRRF